MRPGDKEQAAILKHNILDVIGCVSRPRDSQSRARRSADKQAVDTYDGVHK